MGGARYLIVFNAGSSSLKLEVFAVERELRSCVRVTVAGIGRPHAQLRVASREPQDIDRIAGHRPAAALLLERLAAGGFGIAADAGNVAATAHRVVHGGEDFFEPVVVDEDVLRRLEMLEDLAPLHNPAALAVMYLVRERLPRAPMAAAFDTAFYKDIPEPARVYAVPREWGERFRIRRYGFHGIAHEYLYRRYSELRPNRPRPDRVLSLQLGQGCSITALADGRPVETSMGFTPLEGLVMGTRSGDVDPGVLLRLARAGESWEAIEDALQHRSGLVGLSGITDDMRDLVAGDEAGDPRAALALAAFCHRAVKYAGAYAAVLGGVDAMLFGGGIGENAPAVRSRICARFAWLGLALDEPANAACAGSEQSIARRGSAIDVHVIPVREEAAIALAARECLAAGAS
jgi:acetate kinase